MESPKSRIKAVLSQGAQTAKQLSDTLGLSVKTVTRALEEMPGDVVQVGKGGSRNNAALYGLRDKRTTSPSQILRDGQVQSSQDRAGAGTKNDPHQYQRAPEPLSRPMPADDPEAPFANRDAADVDEEKSRGRF